MKTKDAKKRFEGMKKLRSRGLSLAVIGSVYNVSAERARQILKRGKEIELCALSELDVVQKDEFTALIIDHCWTLPALVRYFRVSRETVTIIATELNLLCKTRKTTA